MTDTATTATAPQVHDFKGVTVPAPGTFVIDGTHSQVGFVVRHLMVSKVRGRFAEYEGTVNVAENLVDSTVDVTVKVASIDTREEARDNHLRADDFFSAETFPELTFKSTKVEHKGGSKFAVTGDLTIRGTTKPVTLDATFEGVVQDPWGGQRIGFTATAEIDRYDFGLTYNAAIEAGGVVISRKITIELEIEAVRQA
jgi:polyisoprenoid-binding protein YceI